MTAAGLVKPLNLPLTEFKTKVRQAAQGILPLEEDPLAGGEPGPQLDYSIIAEWAPSDVAVPYYVNPRSHRASQKGAISVLDLFVYVNNGVLGLTCSVGY